MVKQIFNNLFEKITIKKVMLLLLIAYIIPTFINYDFDTENRFVGAKISMPYLYAGDQVHYYTLVYSLLKDKDFDVRNNYDDSEFNLTRDIGYLFRGQHVFREAGYFNFDTKEYKPLLVLNTSENIKRYGKGKMFDGTPFFETPDPGKDYGIIMIRPLGLPLFYYTILLPFSFVSNPEPLVVFLSVFLVLLSVYLFFLTLNYFLKDEKTSALFALFLGISSELWTYSKLFYPDVLQLFLLSLIVYLFIVKDSNLIVGILFAVGIFARPLFIIPLPIFVVYRFFHLKKYNSFSKVEWNIFKLINFERIRSMFLLLLPVFLILVIQLYLNHYFFGGVFSNPNLDSLFVKNIFEGLLASFFRMDKGLFIFSPILIFIFFGLRSFYKKYRIDSIFIYSLLWCFILYFSLTLISWQGLDTYSMRHYLPIIPYFFIPMAFWYKEVTRTEKTRQKNRIGLIWFYIALAVSIVINFQAAIFHTLIWDGPPWKIISLLIENWGRISFF